MKNILETERLILREFAVADAASLALVLSDPEAMKYYPAPLDLAGTQQWIDRNQRRYTDDGVGLWAMVLKTSGATIGD